MTRMDEMKYLENDPRNERNEKEDYIVTLSHKEPLGVDE